MITAQYSEICLEQDVRYKAVATARLICYAAEDVDELNLDDCRRLLVLCATLIKIKFGIHDHELC